MNERATPYVISGVVLALIFLGFMIWRSVGPTSDKMDKATIAQHIAMKKNK